MAKSSEDEPSAPATSSPRRVYVRYPANWDTLTVAQKQAVAMAMARELRRALRFDHLPASTAGAERATRRGSQRTG